jgi:heat shock protein HspQ
MASTATQESVEDLLRDIESQMDVLRQYTQEDTIWDGTAVYVSRQRTRPIYHLLRT